MTGHHLADTTATKLPSSWLALFFMVCFLILVARNSFPFAFPALYAEDGTWIGGLLRDGFFQTAFNARVEFPVLGLVMAQGLALLLSEIFFGGDLTSIPLLISVVSCVLLSLVAMLPLLLLHDILGRSYAILLGVMIACLPVGSNGDEIFGRMLNLGFYSTCVAQILLYCLLYRDPPPLHQALMYAVILVLMLTFPVVIGQFLLFISFHALIQLKSGQRRWATWILCTVMLGVVAAALLGKNFTGPGGANLPFKASALVEFAGARSILYPLVAPFYSSLTDTFVIALVSGVVGLGGFLCWKSRPGFVGLLDYRTFFFVNFMLVLFAMVVMRSGLTQIFSDYTTTFPDRYFVGLNISFLIMLIALLAGMPSPLVRNSGLGLLSLLVVTWVATLPIFELATPTMGDRQLGTLRDVICKTSDGTALKLPSASENLVTMPIYPVWAGHPWRISIPKESFQRTVALQCHGGSGPGK